MAYALTLRLDEATASWIDGMVEAVPTAGWDMSHPHRRYPAHMKLAVSDLHGIASSQCVL
jgi:hypothetical protein